jgi:hypothetical protein
VTRMICGIAYLALSEETRGLGNDRIEVPIGSPAFWRRCSSAELHAYRGLPSFRRRPDS